MKETTIFVEENNKEYSILIGENARDNENIIKISHPEDIWFHVDNMSSAHIILKSEGDKIPKKYLNKISGLFKEYSKKFTCKYNVIYTSIKNVKLTKIPGAVTTSNVKKIKF